MKTGPLFYIAREEEDVAGPYDLVQMAGLLRRKIITAETPTCLAGTEDWRPFSWQPQFIIVREMPPGAVSARVDALDEAARAEERGPFPWPSAETLLMLGGMTMGALLAGGISFLIAWSDATAGWVLMVVGGGAVMVAHCLTLARLMDEDYWTLALVMFVPMGDIYYFLSNFWRYFPLFCVKYIGAAVCLGAVLGLAAAH